MKILHLVDVPWDSGLAHYALMAAQGQKQEGHHVFVSALPGEKPWRKAHRLGLKTLPMVKFKNLGALRRFIHDHGIQVLNAHTGSTHSLAVASALGQKVAVVRTRSDARVLKPRPGRRFLYKHTQRVISAAEYIRESFIKDLKVPANKVVTIYQGIQTIVKAPLAFPKHPVIGIVARLDPVKGHRYLIEALFLLKEIYPSLRLRIAGQEENIKIPQLRAIAERLRVDQRVEFSGFQSDVAGFMEGCSVGAVSSTGSEAVSRVALEWMACGRPLVSTSVGCLPEIVQDSVCGYLVPPKDAPALASAFAKLIHEPDAAKIMGAQALARVKGHFTHRQFIMKTLEVYKSALSEIIT